MRILLRKLLPGRVYSSVAECQITDNLEKAAAHFQKYGWAYIENIISDEFYKELIRNWPSKIFFDPPTKLAKSYNSGFSWLYGIDPNFNRFDPYHRYQIVPQFLKYLRSPEFVSRITKFVGSNQDFVCYSYSMNMSITGSQVTPHKDGIQSDSRAKKFINIVFFINATGGKNSGNLSLSKDDELKDLIIEPANLKNTCLIYDSLADFYHGFRPVAKGKFRWAAISQFCPTSYVEK